MTNNKTVYLTNDDSLETLWKFLKKWCIAARARFNEDIISFRTNKYTRAEALKDRKTKPNTTEINAKIHIFKDGEAIRILGGWIGNGINDKCIWSKVIDKIANYFECWGGGNSMICGCTSGKWLYQWSSPMSAKEPEKT